MATMYSSQMVGILTIAGDYLDYSTYELYASENQLDEYGDVKYRPHVAFTTLHKAQMINEILHSSLPEVFPTKETIKVRHLQFSNDLFMCPHSAKMEVVYNHDEISNELLNEAWETIRDVFTVSSGYAPFVEIEGVDQLQHLFERKHRHVPATVLGHIISSLVYEEYDDEPYMRDNRNFDCDGFEDALREEAITGSCSITSEQVQELLSK